MQHSWKVARLAVLFLMCWQSGSPHNIVQNRLEGRHRNRLPPAVRKRVDLSPEQRYRLVGLGLSDFVNQGICRATGAFRLIEPRRRNVSILLFMPAGCEPCSDRRVGQTVGFSIILAADVGDRKLKRAGQLLADPIKGIQAWTAAGVLALHLPDHHFRIGEDVQGGSFQL